MSQIISHGAFFVGGMLWMLGLVSFDRYQHAVPLVVYCGAGTTLSLIGWLLWL